MFLRSQRVHHCVLEIQAVACWLEPTIDCLALDQHLLLCVRGLEIVEIAQRSDGQVLRKALGCHHRCLLEADVRVVAVPVPFEELQEAGLVVRMLDRLALVVAGQVQLEGASVPLETVVLVEASPFLAVGVVPVAKLELVVEVQDLPYLSLLGDHASVPSIYKGHIPLIWRLVQGQMAEEVVLHVAPSLMNASGKCPMFEAAEGALPFVS